MNEFIRNRCPDWADEIMLEKDLIMGNDIDSLLSCNLLENITNGKWKINYFYDFEKFYRHEITELSTIGVDIAFTKNVRTFDNHVTKKFPHSPYNKHSMNPNNYYDISASRNYYKKYPFSTLMVIMAYYKIPLPKSDIGKDIILAIDSAFKGHYTTNQHFKDVHTTWLERMGYSELYDRLKKKTSEYYRNIQEYFGINEPIYINSDGLLVSNINFEALQPYFDFPIGLPNKQFKIIKTCKREGHNINEKDLPDYDDLISLAFTGKNYVTYTYV